MFSAVVCEITFIGIATVDTYIDLGPAAKQHLPNFLDTCFDKYLILFDLLAYIIYDKELLRVYGSFSDISPVHIDYIGFLNRHPCLGGYMILKGYVIEVMILVIVRSFDLIYLPAL